MTYYLSDSLGFTSEVFNGTHNHKSNCGHVVQVMGFALEVTMTVANTALTVAQG